MGNRVKNDWRFKTRSRADLLRIQKGFTLIELVVVIAILRVLAAITVPRVSQFLNQATQVAYEADLAIVQSAVSAWYSDLLNDQFLGSRQFPSSAGMRPAKKAASLGGKKALRTSTR